MAGFVQLRRMFEEVRRARSHASLAMLSFRSSLLLTAPTPASRPHSHETAVATLALTRPPLSLCPPARTSHRCSTDGRPQVRLSVEPPPTAGGYPLRTLPEATEVLLKPKMFYELQRGVKKLRF